jgi:hypothetical protein
MRAAFALLTIILLAPVDAPAKTINVRGEGVASCRAWSDAHTRKTDRFPVQDSWLLGYVNAVAGFLDFPGVEDFTAKFHNRDLVNWIDDYCSAHPEEPIIRAADALMRELARLAMQADGTAPGEEKH